LEMRRIRHRALSVSTVITNKCGAGSVQSE